MNSSGPFTFGGTTAGVSIQDELFLSGSQQLSISDSHVRRLANKLSGQINLGSVASQTYQWTDTAQVSCQGLGGDSTLFDGTSVAISADGNTLAIGAPYDRQGAAHSENIGSVFVFVRSGDTWNFQTRIRPDDYALYSYYDSFYAMTFYYGPQIGNSVALSSDGNYLIIGGSEDNSAGTTKGVGRVWVYTRSGTTWTKQTSFYPPDYTTSGSGYVGFGINVAMTPDATTLLVGGPNDNTNTGGNGAIGAAWIYTRSGTTWTKQAKLVPTGYVQGYGGNYFGTGLSISSDGNTAIVGGRGERNGTYGASGACYVFTRSGSSWSQQVRLSPTLVPSLPNGSYFGKSTAVSSDGNTLVVAAPQNYSLKWGPSVFTRSGTTWTYRTTLTSTQALSSEYQGTAVGIAPNAKTPSNYDIIFTSGTDSNSAISVFTGSGGSWTQTAQLKPANPAFPPYSPSLYVTYRLGSDPTTDFSPLSVSSNSRIFAASSRYGTTTVNNVTYGGTLVFSK